METFKKLYRAHSVIDNYKGKINVAFMWFVCERDNSIIIPYDELIEGYESLLKNKDRIHRDYAEVAINEKFREIEIKMLRDYLKNYHDSELIVEEVPLPLNDEGQRQFYSAVAIGGEVGFYQLCEEEEYDLNFKVWAYYDTRFCIAI